MKNTRVEEILTRIENRSPIFARNRRHRINNEVRHFADVRYENTQHRLDVNMLGTIVIPPAVIVGHNCERSIRHAKLFGEHHFGARGHVDDMTAPLLKHFGFGATRKAWSFNGDHSTRLVVTFVGNVNKKKTSVSINFVSF